MRPAQIAAAVVLVAAVLWLASGQWSHDEPPPPSAAAVSAAVEKVRVRVRPLKAEPRVTDVVVQGVTRASRALTVRAETAGRVAEVLAAEGSRVEAGAPILRLAMDDRQARLAEAEAELRQRQIEYDAARQLERKDFAPRTRLAEAEARLEEARAKLAAIRLDIDRTVVRAPFAGVLQDRPVELGDVVAAGAALATLLDLDPIAVEADVSERDVAAIADGASAQARLATGVTLDGRVTYISAAARATTRTFLVRMQAPNPDHAIPEGVTAQMRLPTRQVMAHRVPPSVLTLNDAGQLGVKAVTEADMVAFLPVRVVGEGPDGLWIAGLPETVTLITLGQDYVRAGQQVDPVPEGQPS